MGGLDWLKLEYPSHLKREVEIILPTSKSISNRLLIIQALSQGRVEVKGHSDADDTRFLAQAIHQQGKELWMGDGGTAIRFGLAWAAVTEGSRVITGSEHLKSRPISKLVEALQSMGADINFAEQNSRPPLQVTGGKLKGGALKLDGSLSSQFVSALLLVAPTFEETFVLTLDENQVSIPYIEMTCNLMKQAGARIEWQGNTIVVEPHPYGKSTFEVEADWSSASYFYSWVALNPELEVFIPALNEESLQGDAQVATVFNFFGVETIFNEKGGLLKNTSAIKVPEELNCLEFPDLAQTIAVTAGGLGLDLRLTGLQTLRVKETDRIHALHMELMSCGIESVPEPDALFIKGSARVSIKKPRIKTYGDHRMAMAFAPMVSVFGDLEIENPQVVSKSFPNYWEEVAKLGVNMLRT
jgi:3-phosphoshikimate 1-carboxyvinyltransferase